MKLISIPKGKYDEFRLDVLFKGYKWDPQFVDNNTIAKHVLVITEEEHAELELLTEQLAQETVKAEEFLNENLKLSKPLSLPRQTRNELKRMKNYEPGKHIRLMRFDFHPVAGGGWAVSEVNSDVPGGFAEASIMPGLAGAIFKNKNYRYKSFAEIMICEIAEKVKPNGRIMFVHCTSYSDDRQVMQFLGDKLSSMGFQIIYAAADHLRFENNTAICILDGNEGEVDVIFRFTPLEWLIGIKPKRWQGYFDTTACSCNHPAAIFAQTKRFPLVWKELEKHGIELSAWRKLLPETLEVKDARGNPDFIYKPACGRVGEGIAIKEACKDGEYEKILEDVKRRPKRYIAQRMFESRPLISDEGESFHVCLGVYSVGGKAAGYYARISKTPRIDSNAADIAVLIEPGVTPGPKSKCVQRVIPSVAEESLQLSVRRQGSLDSARDDKSIMSGVYGKNAFEIWCANTIWAPWVRPVPFVAFDAKMRGGLIPDSEIPKINYMNKAAKDTAVFLDLCGSDGVKEGLALAGLGWRPIPLYNGTNGQHGAMALVDNSGIETALIRGADELKSMSFPDNAPPVFLLDSNRTNRYKMNVSVFDNSWDLYPQDIPSAEYFLNNGISKILIRGDRIQKDLIKIFYKFQKRGIKIYFTNGFEEPKEVTLRKPPKKYQ